MGEGEEEERGRGGFGDGVDGDAEIVDGPGFVVAALPAGQLTRDVTSESDQVAWVRPGDAVAAVDAGETLMLPPTYLCCRDLTQYDDVAAVLAGAGDREIRTIMPTVRIDGDQAYLETT